MQRLAFLLLMFLILSCGPSRVVKDTNFNLEKEMKALSTDQEKSDFLYNLWQQDQDSRKADESEIIAQYGYPSKEYDLFWTEFASKNKEIFNSLKRYLEVHGYPKTKEVYHELAINSFPTIIGNNPNFEEKKELLPYLYNAYKSNDCSLDDVAWVLGEMYESKNKGQRYKMKSNRFTTEQEFVELREALELDLEL